MASLLYPDDGADQSQWPTSSGGLLTPPDDRPAQLQPDPRADALGDTYRTISDYMARQQAKSEAEGYWTGGGLLEGGHPTGKGLLDAIGQTGTAVALGTGGPGERPPPGFTAYHGSPHSFDAFSNDAIGTGEGAQAYGHGMYLAERESVARGYRDALSKSPLQAELDAADAAVGHAAAGTDAEYEAALNARDAVYKRWLNDPSAGKPAGHMYEVHVQADPAHFLDWDKPLSEQHPVVQGAINSIADNSVALSQRIMDARKNNIPITGQDVVSALAREGKFNDPRIAQALQQAGLPGIRYLDQGSRGAGEGSRNTVVFSPEIMEIIRKYGLAWLLGGGAAGGTVMGGGQPEQ